MILKNRPGVFFHPDTSAGGGTPRKTTGSYTSGCDSRTLRLSEEEEYAYTVPSAAPSQGGTTRMDLPETRSAARLPESSDSRSTSSVQKRKPRKRYRFRFLKALLLVVLVVGISVYLSNVILTAVYDVFGLKKEDIDVEVDIPEGSSVVAIADILKESGVISQPMVFRAYSRLKGTDELFQYGTYSMNEKMSYDEIIVMLQEKVPRKDVVDITIPEGYTAVDIAELLEEAGVCDGDEFLQIVRSGDIEHELISSVGGGKYRYFKLEGYLFPDTYQFYLGESASSAVRRFLDRFQEVYETEILPAMGDTSYSLDEILTLASIIQRESSGVETMDMVSSVFHNRLENPDIFPSLQSDPTISYVTDNIVPLLDVQDDGYYSAYSTYICTGLPVGPICNPGVNAIKAAIYPASSNYYFFVTDQEGNYYFAETDYEHEINKEKAGIGG